MNAKSNSSAMQKPLELVVLICGAITLGTAYYLLALALPTWQAVPFSAFLPAFREVILNIGMSQLIFSNIALVGSIILFVMSRDKFWLIAVLMLLLSLPLTMFLLMPINIHFLEAVEPALSEGYRQKLESWGHYQILRLIGDGLAFIAMCKPVIWRRQLTNKSTEV